MTTSRLVYTEEMADYICKIVATHPYGLPKLYIKFPDMPHPDTVREWRWQYPLFASKYAEAKRFQAELMAESIEDVTDELMTLSYVDKDGATRLDSGMVAHARLVVDSRKWQASKLAPKIYGDRSITEHTTTESVSDVKSRMDEAKNESLA